MLRGLTKRRLGRWARLRVKHTYRGPSVCVAGGQSVVLQPATCTDGPSRLLVRLKLTKRVYCLFSVVKCNREVVQPLWLFQATG